MLSFAKVCLIGLASVKAWTSIDQPGLGVSLTKVGMNNIKDIAAPYIFGLIEDIDIPIVEFDGGNLKNLIIHVPQPPLEDLGLNFEYKTQGIEIFAAGIAATISSDFTYTYWITVSGEAAIKINKMSIDVEVDISTQVAQSGQNAPKLEIQKCNINVNPDDVDITLTGGLASKIAGAFIPFLKSTVVPDIIKVIDTTITTGIDTTINADLYEYGTNITIPEFGDVTVDYAQMHPQAQITEQNVFEVALNGTFYNVNHTDATLYPDPVAFPVRNPTGRSLQVHLTEYVINTAAEADLTSDNRLDVSYILYELLKINITTTNLGTVLPQLITKYGDNVTINMGGKCINKPSYVHFTDKHYEVHGSLAIFGIVGEEEAFYGEFDLQEAAGSLYTHSDGTIFGQIDTLNIGTLDPATYRNKIGVTAAQMQTQLQTLVSDWQVGANKNLTAGTVIPEILGITGKIEANFNQGFVEVGIDATPTTGAQIRDFFAGFLSRKRYQTKKEEMAAINLQFV